MGLIHINNYVFNRGQCNQIYYIMSSIQREVLCITSYRKINLEDGIIHYMHQIQEMTIPRDLMITMPV